MVEYIEELDVEPQLHVLGQGKPLREVEVTPRKIGTAQRVTPEVSELAILGAVASKACPSARIDGRDKGIGIEPLNCARLCDARNGIVFIERHAGNNACELRPAAVHNAISICRIGRAQDGKRNPAMPKHGSRHLPAVQCIAKKPVLDLDRQLIDILRIEIVPDVVVAGTVVASQVSREGGTGFLPPRTAGIRRSRRCPCNGSTCS